MVRCEMCDVHPVSVTTPAMMLKVGDEQKHHHVGVDRVGGAGDPRSAHCCGSALGTMQDIATRSVVFCFFCDPCVFAHAQKTPRNIDMLHAASRLSDKNLVAAA